MTSQEPDPNPVSSEQYRQARDLFHEIFELSKNERRRVLRERNVAPEVLRIVDGLFARWEDEQSRSIQSHGESASIDSSQAADEIAKVLVRAIQNENPGVSVAKELSDEAREALRRLNESNADEEASADSRLVEGMTTTKINRYVSEGEVASGGMGTILRVWDEPLGRHLAMKVLRTSSGSSARGAKTTQQHRRFMDEARITGQLNHPGVVPVHELGVDHDGRAFFTMRLVEGLTLKEVFSNVAMGAEGWSMTRALNAILRACETVAFAHSKGIIHRDLKPANIMVGEFGETYVMDWGLAKSIDSKESDQRKDQKGGDDDTKVEDPLLATLTGEILGTPTYMPPEQARGRIEDVGPGADVYAMGCVLYHLLAGHAPYSERDRSSSVTEVLHRVIAGPPEALDHITKAPGELVAICERAMARPIDQRYRDMGTMRDDLRSYLEGRVVQAHRTGAFVEFRKWVGRNRGMALSLALAILFAVTGSIWVAVVQSQKASIEQEKTRVEKQAKEDALSSADEARRARADSDYVAEYMVKLLGAADPLENPGDQLTARDLLRGGLQDLMNSDFEDNPLLEAKLASALGDSLYALREFEDARAAYSKTYRILDRIVGSDNPETLSARGFLAQALQGLGNLEEAEKHYREALRGLRRIEGETGERTLNVYYGLGTLNWRLDRIEEALVIFRDVGRLFAAKLGPSHVKTILAEKNAGTMLQGLGRFEEAERILKECLEKQRETLGADHPNTLNTMSELGSLYRNLGRYEESEEISLDCLSRYTRTLGDSDYRTIRFKGTLGQLYIEYAPEKAEPYLRESAEQFEAIYGLQNIHTLSAHNRLAAYFGSVGRVRESIELLEKVLTGRRDALGENHGATHECARNLAAMYSADRRNQEAIGLLVDSLEKLERAGGEARDIRLTHKTIGVIYANANLLGQAESHLKKALDLIPTDFGDSHPEVLKTQVNLYELYFLGNRIEESIELASEVYETRRRSLGRDHQLTIETRVHLIDYLDAGDSRIEAARLIAEHVASLRHRTDEGGPNTQPWIARLEELVQRIEETLEPDYLEEGTEKALETALSLGVAYGQLDRVNEGALLFERAFEQVSSSLGEEHSLSLDILEEWVRLLVADGAIEEASDLAQELVDLTSPDEAAWPERAELLATIRTAMGDEG